MNKENPDLEELMRYNREAKQAACEHVNTSRIGYYGYETLCHDCGGRISAWETHASKLAYQQAVDSLAKSNA